MEIQEKLYNQMQGASGYWFNKSADLNTSARVLWQAMENDSGKMVASYSVYKMLMGMSIEAMAKAFCVAKSIDVKAIHNLTTLVNDAGFKFSKDENKTLKVLTDYIEWAGKYPTPKPKNGPGNLQKHWDDISNLGAEAFDYSKLHAIWRKMSDEYIAKHNET